MYATAISDLSMWEIYPILDPKTLQTWMDQSVTQRSSAGVPFSSLETNSALGLSQKSVIG